MKAYIKSSVWGVLLLCIPLIGHAALSRQNNLLGKFFVSSVNGDVTCISDGRILELKKGDSILARGAVIQTPDGANVTLVFSNGTGVYTDEKTRFEVEKFDQEFFTPNNNLRVEPSNSSTIVKLATGRVVISTPRLLSGTTMVYETAHAMVGFRGEKVMIEATEKQTHVAMISGNATVNPRGADGTFVSIGKRIVTGQEAFVKNTLGGSTISEEEFVAETAIEPKAPTASAVAASSLATTTASSAPAAPGEAVTTDSEATVLKLLGSARAKLTPTAAETPVVEGAKLPKGSLITTDDGSELQLQPFEGTVATLRPNSSLLIEKLSLTTDTGVLTKQTALFALKAGTVVSTLDPAKKAINDYAIRTPKGIASAKGTSFSVSIEDDEGFAVAATADTVTFTTSSGEIYSIEAGNVSLTPAGGEPQAPISLAAAVAASPAFANVIQTALNAVANIVQNNIGSLAPSSASDLITKVAQTAAAALPSQANAIATQVVNAVNWPSSATAENPAAATAAVIQAIVSVAPTQAAQIATAAALAVPGQVIAISAAAARGSPSQAAQIASAVTQTFVQLTPEGGVTPATLQTAAALAAAVTTSAPDQAAPVASAVMQALSQASPLSTPLASSHNAATIASAVTAAAPSQAVPVAATMMRTLTQTPTFGEATPEIVAQTAATLAAAVTVVVPPQAQEVATAVMQLLVQISPNASPASLSQTAGMIAAAVSAAAPGQSSIAIMQGVANAANQPLSSVQFAASQSTAIVAQIAQQVSLISQNANSATQQSNFSNAEVARGFGGGTGNIASGTDAAGGEPPSDANTSTSIIITEFDPGSIEEFTADLEAATAAPGGVQFSPDTTNGGIGGSVTPFPTVPVQLPIDETVSPSNNG